METCDYSNFYSLEKENELRIIVGDQARDVKIELVGGLAEIHGSLMDMHKSYCLPVNASVAIFTWEGCTIKVTGKPVSVHVVADTLMILYVTLHASLEERRIRAASDNTNGPITLIVGPKDVGKSTLCRFLLNYAVHCGKCPLYIDLDVGQNSISIPGTVAVLTVQKPADIVAGLEDEAMQVYHFGYNTPGHNIILYNLLMKKLGQTLLSGLKRIDKKIKHSGVIINSCGWIRGYGYNAITLAALNFEIDVLCVIHEERLYMQLLQDMPSSVKVHFVPKMDGAIERSPEIRSQSREARVKEYFYGPSNELQPFTFVVKYSEIQVFRVKTRPLGEGGESMNNVSLDNACLVPVPLDYTLLHQVLALSSSDTVEKDLILAHVIGFICVTSINLTESTITVLSPQPPPLPKKILLIGSTRLIQQH
ncbi:protein CLP1 homolog [Nephila pilipes]|uniref:Protein CLP1 homolog n=1 Tax=Nephila pilipes TaxID=299642 RepID=A0A8X6PNI4_NEPPI|nr:protein CLP1 homolog [Nephila pilipes]